MEYASNAKANAGLATGIIGTALGALGSMGGLVGMHANVGEETPVTRHELNYVEQIAGKDHEIARLEAEKYTDNAVKQLSDQLAVKFNQIDQTLNAQAVYNATLNGTVGCIQGQVNALLGMTRRVIPNAAVNPGWGDVTITPAGGATVKGAVPSGN